MKCLDISVVVPAKADCNNNRWLPLWLHLWDTASTLKYLYFRWLPECAQRAMLPGCDAPSASAILTAAAMLHDIGKCTPVFVAHISRTANMPELINRMEAAGYPAYWPRMYTVPHSEAGEVLLKRFGAPDGFSSIIGAHHGKPQEKDFDAETRWINHAHLLTGRPQDEAVWRGAQHALVRWAEAEAGLSLTDLPVLPQSSQALLCGLLIMADWIASNTLYFPLLSMDDNGSSVDTESRFRRAMERLSLPPCWQTSADPSWAEGIYNLRFGTGEMLFTPYPAQSEIARIAADIETPGLMILEAPMGSGKTESALAAAELLASHVGSGGIFFGLPTQATANALFGRLKDWAERQSEDVVNTINLSHRMATLNLDYRDLLEGAALVGEESGLEVHSFFQGKKTALLSNFVVGTVDQLLMAALRRKHVMLRQLGLSGKVVIIDEVHAYDAYMSQYLQRTLQWLGAWRTPVILLSATLPASTREKLMDAYLGGAKKRDAGAAWRKSMDYPLLTWSDGGHVFQRRLTPDGRETTVQTAVISDADRLPLLREWLSEGGCAGVICNTVARAQDLAMEARQAMPDTEVMICHAQFVMPQRAKIEDELKTRLGRNGKRPSKLLLVGTQVIEQSLDIDMDLLITDLCPMDMLLQRIGRLHRHARIRPERLRAARCFVTAAEDDALIKNPIYEEYLLRRTLAILPEKLTVPTDIAPLVQCVYGDALPEDAS
ncbi:MAG: CRISPR-associated helicase Cas3', partial [bacterium]